jgi:hypothetical protein
MMPVPETARAVARELLDSGHPRGGAMIFELVNLVEKLEEQVQQSQSGRDVLRLRAVIQHALQHQTNGEIERWLRAALTGADSAIFDNQGRRVDQ